MTDFNIISGYGIFLRRLTEDKIELVRKWRNDPKISQYMEYRKIISAAEQLQWFHRINNEGNYYYLIIVDNNEIGLIDIRDIDYEKKVGEPGIFIWDDNYLNSDISFRACLLMIDFAFDTLKLQNMIIHVLSDNKKAIQFNKFLGYKLIDNQEGIYNQEYHLSVGDYKKRKCIIARYL